MVKSFTLALIILDFTSFKALLEEVFTYFTVLKVILKA